jgi:two-component system, LytTR family, sensor histidine kinase AgrC
VEDEVAMRLLRRQRHSFLNHLQVISGWLQLGRPEKAGHYLDAVAAHMTAESDALRHASTALGLLVLELGLEAETHGVRLEWQVSQPAAETDLADLRSRVMGALTATADLPDGDRAIAVRLGPEISVIHTPSGKGEG